MTDGPILSLPREVALSLRERMAKKMAVTPSGCIEWTGAMSVDGYGMTTVILNGKRRSISAHRASWMVSKGPIPKGLVIDHLCRVRKCINVEHLEPITDVQNTARGWRARRATLKPWRTVRIEDGLWAAAMTKAETEGRNLSDVIRDALRAYVEPALSKDEVWRQASPNPEYMIEKYPEGTMTYEEWSWEKHQTEERARRLTNGETVGPRLSLAEHLTKAAGKA